MKVHVLTYGKYEDETVIGVFETWADARIRSEQDMNTDVNSLAHEAFGIQEFELETAKVADVNGALRKILEAK